MTTKEGTLTKIIPQNPLKQGTKLCPLRDLGFISSTKGEGGGKKTQPNTQQRSDTHLLFTTKLPANRIMNLYRVERSTSTTGP